MEVYYSKYTAEELDYAINNAMRGVYDESGYADPDVVYRVTRPRDWLPMPTPGDDEIYILGHMPGSLDGAFTIYTYYNTTSLLVEFGNLQDGVFVAKSSHEITTGRYYFTVPNADYGDVTGEGDKQYLVRIQGDMRWVDVSYDDNTFSYGVPKLVDAVIGRCQHFGAGHANSFYLATQLRYVRFVGNVSLVNGLDFPACKNLLCICADYPVEATSLEYSFYNCTSLLSVSENIFANVVKLSSAFQVSSYLPEIRFPKTLSSARSVFRNVARHGVVDGKLLDTSAITDFTYFVYDSNIKEVVDLDISNMTVCSYMFNLCRLTRLTFAGETTPGGVTMDLTYTKMGHTALVEMIASLPTATAAATITITGVPGASALTDAEIAVATAKNWTITI